jgi:hypothetical protein
LSTDKSETDIYGKSTKDTTGSSWSNPVQAAVDGVFGDSLSDETKKGMGAFLAGAGVVGAVAGFDSTLFKGAGRKAILGAGHKGLGHVKDDNGKWHNPKKEESFINKEGKEEWLDKEGVSKAEKAGWTRNEDGRLVHPSHSTSSNLDGGSVRSENASHPKNNTTIDNQYNGSSKGHMDSPPGKDIGSMPQDSSSVKPGNYNPDDTVVRSSGGGTSTYEGPDGSPRHADPAGPPFSFPRRAWERGESFFIALMVINCVLCNYYM